MLTYIVVDKFLSSRKFYKYSSIGVVLEICRVKKSFDFSRLYAQLSQVVKKKKTKNKDKRKENMSRTTQLESLMISQRETSRISNFADRERTHDRGD